MVPVKSVVARLPLNVVAVRTPDIFVLPTTSKVTVGIVEPMPTFPVESIATLVLLAVINSNLSSSAPAEDSALIRVSPSTSLIPPRGPQLFPTSNTSNFNFFYNNNILSMTSINN